MEDKSKLITPQEDKNLLYGRIKAIKKLLPKDWRKRLVKNHEEYDKLEVAVLVKNVHLCRVAHEPITVILEEIASVHQAELLAEEKEKEKQEKRLEKILKRQKLIPVC